MVGGRRGDRTAVGFPQLFKKRSPLHLAEKLSQFSPNFLSRSFFVLGYVKGTARISRFVVSPPPDAAVSGVLCPHSPMYMRCFVFLHLPSKLSFVLQGFWTYELRAVAFMSTCWTRIAPSCWGKGELLRKQNVYLLAVCFYSRKCESHGFHCLKRFISVTITPRGDTITVGSITASCLLRDNLIRFHIESSFWAFGLTSKLAERLRVIAAMKRLEL